MSAAYTTRTLWTSSRPQTPRTPNPVASPSEEQISLVNILRSGEDSRLRRHRPEQSGTGQSSEPVVLFCGAEEEIEMDWDERRSWAVQILPETKPPEPACKRQKRSNGCGARVHARATADLRWCGLLDGVSDNVVPLQHEYFTPDMKRELLLGKEHCGCSRSGVGCAICGNPLGALFTPCARHSPSAPQYTFLRSSVSPPLLTSTRRLSGSDDVLTGRGEREALQRRIRDREELTQLRARIRAAQQNRPNPRDLPPREPPPLPSFATVVRLDAGADNTADRSRAGQPPPLTPFLIQQAREARRLREEESRIAAMQSHPSSQDSSHPPRPWSFASHRERRRSREEGGSNVNANSNAGDGSSSQLPRRSRESPPRRPFSAMRARDMAAAEAAEERAFELWADETLQRATATAAASELETPDDVELTAADFRAMLTTSSREMSEEEVRRDWQRSLARTLNQESRDWLQGTIERTTALPEVPDEQEEEEAPQRSFFER